jgi:hypothetical protein
LEKVKARLPAGFRGERREIMKKVVLNNGVEMPKSVKEAYPKLYRRATG